MRSLLGLALFASFGLLACGGEPYQPCSPSMNCSGETRLCLSNTSAMGRTARFCTARCNTPSATSGECPGNAACVRLNGGDPVCALRCNAVSECPFTNAACAVTSDSMGARICSVAP